MHAVFNDVALALGVVLLLIVIASVVLVTRHRPPQPPRAKGEAARVRGTFRGARSYQNYILREIRRGARGRPRS